MYDIKSSSRRVFEFYGIKKEYFASYIGCGLSKCTMWFKGERKLNTEQLQKTHEFLSGKHIKTVEDIMKEE